MRHFADEIKYAVVERGVTTIQKLIKVLEDFDKIRASNNSRSGNRHWRQPKAENMVNTQPQSDNPQYATWRATSSGRQINKNGHGGSKNNNNVQVSGRYEVGKYAPKRSVSAGGQGSSENNTWRNQSSQTPYRIRNLESER